MRAKEERYPARRQKGSQLTLALLTPSALSVAGGPEAPLREFGRDLVFQEELQLLDFAP